jgi:hypothetical protein
MPLSEVTLEITFFSSFFVTLITTAFRFGTMPVQNSLYRSLTEKSWPMLLKMPSKDPIAFKARDLHSVWKRKWVHWIGWLVFVVTVVETFAHLAARPDISLLRWLSPPSSSPVLRPGQYRETGGFQNTANSQNEDESGVSDMGSLHDVRFVQKLQILLLLTLITTNLTTRSL